MFFSLFAIITFLVLRALAIPIPVTKVSQESTEAHVSAAVTPDNKAKADFGGSAWGNPYSGTKPWLVHVAPAKVPAPSDGKPDFGGKAWGTTGSGYEPWLLPKQDNPQTPKTSPKVSPSTPASQDSSIKTTSTPPGIMADLGDRSKNMADLHALSPQPLRQTPLTPPGLATDPGARSKNLADLASLNIGPDVKIPPAPKGT